MLTGTRTYDHSSPWLTSTPPSLAASRRVTSSLASTSAIGLPLERSKSSCRWWYASALYSHGGRVAHAELAPLEHRAARVEGARVGDVGAFRHTRR